MCFGITGTEDSSPAELKLSVLLLFIDILDSPDIDDASTDSEFSSRSSPAVLEFTLPDASVKGLASGGSGGKGLEGGG